MSNNNEEAPPEYECYKFFNLTNAIDIYINDTDNKIKPVFQELGPYCYRYYHEKFNITFSPDGNEVSYNVYGFDFITSIYNFDFFFIWSFELFIFL